MPVNKHQNCENCVNVSNINFDINDEPILIDVSFKVNCGDYIGLIGPNGSGKTTLLKIILGLLKPKSGEISLFGQSLKKIHNRHEIWYIPQRITQNVWQFPASVKEVVASGRIAKVGLFKTFNQVDQKAIIQALTMTDTLHLKDKLINQLSGGERQRVFIARALAGDPRVLILDEPTVGVDINSQEKFYTLLCELNIKHNLTIILVSHDIDVVANEVKTVLFLNKKIIAHGSPKDLLKPQNLQKLYHKNLKFIVHHH